MKSPFLPITKAAVALDERKLSIKKTLTATEREPVIILQESRFL